jgi:hypothetical protein
MRRNCCCYYGNLLLDMIERRNTVVLASFSAKILYFIRESSCSCTNTGFAHFLLTADMTTIMMGSSTCRYTERKPTDRPEQDGQDDYGNHGSKANIIFYHGDSLPLTVGAQQTSCIPTECFNGSGRFQRRANSPYHGSVDMNRYR